MSMTCTRVCFSCFIARAHVITRPRTGLGWSFEIGPSCPQLATSAEWICPGVRELDGKRKCAACDDTAATHNSTQSD